MTTFGIELKKDFSPKFKKGDIVTVATEAKASVGDFAVQIKERKNKTLKTQIEEIKEGDKFQMEGKT
jgi:hypothetical protein